MILSDRSSLRFLAGLAAAVVLGAAPVGAQGPEKELFPWDDALVNPELPAPWIEVSNQGCTSEVTAAWSGIDPEVTPYVLVLFDLDGDFTGLIDVDVQLEADGSDGSYTAMLAGREGQVWYRVHGLRYVDEDGRFELTPPSSATQAFLDRTPPAFVGEIAVVDRDGAPATMVDDPRIEFRGAVADASLDAPAGLPGTGRLELRIREPLSELPSTDLEVDETGVFAHAVDLGDRRARRTFEFLAVDCAGNETVVTVPVTYQVRELTCYPNPFDPAAVDGLRFVFELEQAESGSLKIYGEGQGLVHETDWSLEAGLVDGQLVWDGRNGVGDLVGDGVYVGVVEGGAFRPDPITIVVAKTED